MEIGKSWAYANSMTEHNELQIRLMHYRGYSAVLEERIDKETYTLHWDAHVFEASLDGVLQHRESTYMLDDLEHAIEHVEHIVDALITAGETTHESSAIMGNNANGAGDGS